MRAVIVGFVLFGLIGAWGCSSQTDSSTKPNPEQQKKLDDEMQKLKEKGTKKK